MKMINRYFLAGTMAAALFSVATSTLVFAEDKHIGSKGEGEHGDENALLLSFSTVGDSRQDPASPDPSTLPLSGQDAIWLQNTKALTRILDGVDSQDSKLLFFNGDMIMGYGNAIAPTDTSLSGILKSDVMAFYKQYAFWRGMVASLMERGTYVVPVAGNHETQWKAGGKKAQAANENAWRANMADLILDDARFKNLFNVVPTSEATGDNRAENPGDGSGGTKLATDQSKLSFSFDFQGSHFVVINTDPVGNDSHAPTQWLAADLAAAKARGAQHMFVFGHKLAYTYYFGADVPASPALPLPGKASGLDVDVPARDAFWDVIEQYNATYFCGHEHIFNLSQPRGNAWQILVGSGGSPFEALPTDATVGPLDRYYAWATIHVFKNGKVKLYAYGFDEKFGPTKLLRVIDLP